MAARKQHGGQDARLERGRRLWDRLSSHAGSFERMQAPISELALKTLELKAGDTVLDIGCGAGPNLAALREAVGPTGRVMGIDYSPKMVQRAKARLQAHAWENVEVCQVDFIRAPVEPGRFDAAIAAFSLSAMPDVPAAVAAAERALRPGGKLFAIDLRLVPHGWSAPPILLLGGIYRLLAGWRGVDVLDTVQAAFDHVEQVYPTTVADATRRTTWPPVMALLATKATLVASSSHSNSSENVIQVRS